MRSKVHQFTLLKAPKEVAEKLRVAESAFVCYICRTRIVDGKPHVVEYSKSRHRADCFALMSVSLR